MKIKTIMLGGAAFAMSATAALAEDMTIVSWGGAYTASQQAAYHDPYSAKTGVNIINDASSGEAVAKLRAMHLDPTLARRCSPIARCPAADSKPRHCPYLVQHRPW